MDPLAAASVQGVGAEPLVRDVPAVQEVSGASAKNSGFFVAKKQFVQQFAQIYYTRLNLLRGPVKERLKHLQATSRPDLKDVPVLDRCVDVVKGQRCALIGTLFKEMKLRPTALDEYQKGSGPGKEGAIEYKARMALSQGGHYRSPDDTIILEDEFGRIGLVQAAASGADSPSTSDSAMRDDEDELKQQEELAGDRIRLNPQRLVAGVVAAVIGQEGGGGEFQVEELVFPQMAPQPALSQNSESWVLFVSGLRVGSNPDADLAAQLLMDYVSGYAGGLQDHETAAKISHVVVLGNSLHQFHSAEERRDYRKMKQNSAAQQQAALALKQLDAHLAQLCSTVNVTVLPGELDPSNYTLPQQPLHPVLFPAAHAYNTLELVCNPHMGPIAPGSGCLLLATAGQNVDNLLRYCESDVDPSAAADAALEEQKEKEKAASLKPDAGAVAQALAEILPPGDGLQLMEFTLRWRNMCPTAPDSLACYPFVEQDPFVMAQTPHIYAVGNRRRFGSRVLQGDQGQRTLLLEVPGFAQTHTAVLVNTRTLEARPLRFDLEL